ncbi:MAG TPA: hypothetical protein VFT22_38510 [Kofleriaceae bacterium]|nr:hypothetical protein [Kofleriaceae bacterium]
MTATRIHVALAVVVTAAFVTPRAARAQSAEAEALFQEGKRLMKNGEIAAACDKFEAGDRVEPTAGSELNLARCREANGQIATAWAAYLKAAATAKHTGDPRREAEARKRAASLEPKLVYLTITVPEDSRVEGLVVKRNETTIDQALWDQRVPVDPGEYTISGEAPGYKLWIATVPVLTKSKKVEIPQLEKRIDVRPAEPRPEVRPATPARTMVEDTPPVTRKADLPDKPVARSEAPTRSPGSKKLAIGLAAVGVAAIGASVALGLHANSLEDASDQVCPEVQCADADGVDKNKSARRYALATNIGFGVGGAAIVAAAAVWFFGPRSHETLAVLPMIDADHVGIHFARSF